VRMGAASLTPVAAVEPVLLAAAGG
jgi:hypothetical protein